MSDGPVDGTGAIARRQQWAARVSWYVYAAFVIFSYAGLLAIPVHKSLIVIRGPLASRLHQTGEIIEDLLFHDTAEFLPILFLAATFPLIAGYAVRGFFLLIVTHDISWCRAAAMMFALFTPVSMAVKLALASAGGTRLQDVIANDREYFGMCTLPLVMAVLVAVLAKLYSLHLASSSKSENRSQ